MLGKKSKGFTLLELVITMVIVAILAAIALPNYSNYVYRTRRADGKNMLEKVAAAQERVYTNFNAYASTVTGAPTGNPPAGLGFVTATSTDGHYIVTVGGVGATNQTYTLTATPVTGDVQAADACGALTLDNTGKKSWTGANPPTNGPCW